jgi:hypothetical protein
MLDCLSAMEGRILVYLDVDGVLNTTAAPATVSRQILDVALLANLRAVMDAVPGSAIVLSSSWRRLEKFRDCLNAQLVTAGIAPPIAQTGCVPMPRVPLGHRASLDGELDRHAAQRAEEILESVDALMPLAWIAIDDLDLCRTDRAVEPRSATVPAGLSSAGTATRPSAKDNSAIGYPTPLVADLPKRRRTQMVESAHFVRTNEREGFTDECAALAIQRLQRQLQQSANMARLG